MLEDKARCYETRSEQGDYICQEQGTGQVGAGTWSGEVRELGQEKRTWPGAGELGQEHRN